MKTFNETTENKLDKLFIYLPEVFFWTIIVTRLFIALPLFLAAEQHFVFLHYPVLIIISSLVSVLIVESILTLPSLSTAFFKRNGLKEYQRIAFWSTIVFGIFNQSLIILSWKDTDMSIEALYIYSVLNLASILLAEFISFMTVTKPDKTTKVQTNNVQKEIEILMPTKDDSLETNGLPKNINEILSQNIGKNQQALLIKAAGYDQTFIASILKVHKSTVSRWVN